MKSLDFRIRKLHLTSEPEKKLSKRQPSRVYVNEEALLELTGSKDGGKAITVEKTSADEKCPPREATLWRAPEKLDKAVTQMYDVFRDVCGYKLGETVRITAVGGSIADADTVAVEDISSRDVVPELLTTEELPIFEYNIAAWLNKNCEHVYPGMTIKNVIQGDSERIFQIKYVNGRTTANARYKHKSTSVKIEEKDAGARPNETPRDKLEVVGVKGMDAQVQGINKYLSQFNLELDLEEFLVGPHGLVLHGGTGTGKTMLLDCLATRKWGGVHRIHFKDKLSEIQDTLQRAQAQQPSVVLIDQIDLLIDKERSNRMAVILAICDAFDNLWKEAERTRRLPKVAVIATCSDYVSQLPRELRLPGRLDRDVFLPLPDATAREEILATFSPALGSGEQAGLLQSLGERTHAFNGHDLRDLFLEAQRQQYPQYVQQQEDAEDGPRNGSDTGEKLRKPVPATREDWEQALRLIRPSAMHDINLKPPPIHWTDIGGQESVKNALRVAISLSTESRELLDGLNITPPKGFLLYGPPGCSKTMAAQAMATESGLNFFAVKGAELLNMYVGESERAVRRLFERAREVAPSMIFFDEIDSIAGQRHGFGHGGGASSAASHGGVNVLTTLLNEMDGFETLQGVIVLAATNRPQALDPALLRPGRFDEVIFVAPPDEAARRAILGTMASRGRWAADIDLEDLVSSTNGYSGAEIKGIGAAAGKAVYQRMLFTRTGENVDHSLPKTEVTAADLREAIQAQRRQITAEMLEGYALWERQFKKY